MFRLALLLAIAAITSGRTLNYYPKEFIHRIVGGEDTTIDQYPYIVSFQFKGSNPFHFCGASILNENWIITAAHCADGQSPSEVQIVAGRTDKLDDDEEGGVVMEVAEIIVHEDYNGGTIENDIALLKLSESLSWSDKIGPLPMAQEEGFEYASFDVVGWGTTTDGSTPDILQTVTVPFVDDTRCRRAYGERQIVDSMICAGSGGLDSCQGDSGGPMVDISNERAQHTGIVSWGRGCGLVGYPGVYTEVAYFTSWVEAQIARA